MDVGPARAFRERVRRADMVIGSFIMEMPVRAVPEAYALAGYDFVILDLEHSATDLSAVSQLVGICHGAGIGAVVRIPAGGESSITRVLDMGTDAIMVPAVSSAEHAQEIVTASRYHPNGRRGIAPLVRNIGHLEAGLQQEEPLVIVQIEDRRGVDNVDKIAAIDGIDVVFVGPYDLSQDLGIPGQLGHPDLLAAGRTIAAGAVSHATMGVHVQTVEDAEPWRELGTTFFTDNVDGGVFLDACRRRRAAWGAGSGQGDDPS